MRIPLGGNKSSKARAESHDLGRGFRLRCVATLLLSPLIAAMSQGQTQQAKPKGAEPVPEAAVPAILAAFDKYEVVAKVVSNAKRVASRPSNSFLYLF